jgi:hypothetical protein
MVLKQSIRLSQINTFARGLVNLVSDYRVRVDVMAKKFPSQPAHPERICWGCDRYCPADSLACGNGASLTMHPMELFGKDWDRMGQGVLEPLKEHGQHSKDTG